MAEARLRWGVLGTARIADAVVRGIRLSNNSELAAVASRDGDKAAAWAKGRDVPLYFGSYDEMLSSDRIDAVYIPLPNGMHKEWSVRAAKAGKHVLCEKPIASNAIEVEELIATSQKYGVKIMEAFMYRFHPQTARTQQLIVGGAIGEARIIRASFDFYLRRPHDVRWKRELAGGALMDVGCYCVNAANKIVGLAPTSVTASAIWAEEGVDLTLVGTLEYPNGVLGVIDCSFQVGKNMQQHLEISGTDGLIRVPRPFSKGEEDALIFIDKSDNETEPEQVTVPGANHYHLMVEHFADAALNGKALSYTLEQSLVNMQTLDALSEAARTGQRVTLRMPRTFLKQLRPK